MTWVFAALVTAFGQAWVDFDVYMPDCWADDPARRKKAGIPDGLAFATKPELAIVQVKRLVASGIRVLWAAADEVYGRSADFRDALRASAWPTSSSSPATTGSPSRRTRSPALTRQYPRRCSSGGPAATGRKAPATRDWALLGTTDPREFLLIRRLPGPGEEPVHVLPVLRRRRPPRDPDLFHHHRRPQVASRNTFRTGKDAFGWDQSQARSWTAINRHTALTALAQVRAIAIQSALAGAIDLPAAPDPAPDTPRDTEETTVTDADLQIRTGDAPIPVTSGQPCPPGIPPIRLSAAETGLIERLARGWKAGRLSPGPLAFHLRWSALAAPPPGPRPLAPLQHPPGRTRRLKTADERR